MPKNNLKDFIKIYDDALDYDDNALNGYNCFHNCNVNSRGGDKSTDINADPLLFDPANDDMRLKRNSPCINAGRQTVNDGHTDIGAWQHIYKRYRPNIFFPNNEQLGRFE